MLVSHLYRCLFAHVPKCAGTSIKRALDLEFVDPPHWHCTWQTARDKLGEEPLASYFKFTVIRNPWDRVISAWQMFEQKPWCKQERPHTLKSFLEVVTDESIDYHASYTTEDEHIVWQKTPANIRHHTLPCVHPYYGLADAGGAVKMDLIVPYRRLEQGFGKVCERIGVSGVKLPKANPTQHEHYSRYFDAETRDKAARYFAADIAAFKFKFTSG